MIRVSHDGAVATLSLARPEAKNALPIAAWDALRDAAAQVSDTRVVLLRSDMPGIFSAGADIREFEQIHADPALRARFRTAMRDAIEAVAALPMPVIAAFDGGCYGAAVALALAADIRIAGKDAAFSIPPARLGLGYPRQDIARLAAQVGKGMAGLLLFTGDTLRADEAHRIGLIELSVAKAEETAAALAKSIAGNAPGAIALLKRTLRDPADPRHDAAFEASFGSAEFAEGLDAFAARRTPQYP